MDIKLLRRQANNSDVLTEHGQAVLAQFEQGDTDTRKLILKLCENQLKYLAYDRRAKGAKAPLDQLLALYLLGIKDRNALIRKAAVYGLFDFLYHFAKQDAFGPERSAKAISGLASLLGDSGCDLDAEGLPVTTKGTLTIVEKTCRCVGQLSRTSDFTPMFHAFVPALEELHFWISNHYLDQIYGWKLAAAIVDVFDWLVACDAPLPVPRHPDTYPNYVTELISFCNNHQFHTISDTTTYAIRRLLISSDKHLRDLVATLEIESYEQVRWVILYMLSTKVENGHGKSMRYFAPRIRAGITALEVADEDVPEPLRAWLEKVEAETQA